MCKFEAHTLCAIEANNNCKRMAQALTEKDYIEDEDGKAMPHQWLEGNFPVSAKWTLS